LKRPVLEITLSLVLVLQAAAGLGGPQYPDPEAASAASHRVNSRARPCVRLRAGTSLERAVLGCLEPGTAVTVLGEISGWSQVRLQDDREGWVDSSYLEPLSPGGPGEPSDDGRQPIEPTSDRPGEIEELERQLRDAAALQAATEERLQAATTALEAAGLQASGLRRRVQRLEAAAASDKTEELEAELEAAHARQTELEDALAAAESRLESSDRTNAEQAERIEQLEAAPQVEPVRKIELRRQLSDARDRLRSAEKDAAAKAKRVEQLEAAAQAEDGRTAQLESELSETTDRLRRAEETTAEQASRIESLTGRLAEAEAKLAARELELAAAERAADKVVRVRAPIAPPPEPPRVTVRVPAAVREAQAAAPEEPAPPTQTPAEARVEMPEEPPAEEAAPTLESATDVIRAWAAAWSDQRIDDYLAFYAPGFRPPPGLSRLEWEDQRRQRLSAPAYIRVAISSLRTEPADDGTVRMTFSQEYESDRFADEVTKVLTLVDDSGVWRILSEQATP
jgi:hypothetical protein